MAKTATKNGKQKKPKQGFLPTMEPPTIPEIDTAADELQSVRSQRMELTDQEGKLAESLLSLMHKHDLKVYEFDGKRVEIAALEKVKVRKAKDAENGDEE